MYDLTMVVIAHTPKRDSGLPLTQNDLAGSSKLMNFFDSGIVIGRSAKSSELRYVKQVKVRTGLNKYDGEKVLLFKLKQEQGYTQFIYEDTVSEVDHLRQKNALTEAEDFQELIDLQAQNKTVREIAAETGFAPTTVHRKIKKALELGVHFVHFIHGGYFIRCRGRVDTNPKAMYNLQKYKGISTRYTCPHCGRKKCFTLYVDEDGEPLHETVGRCDHESRCGYHYTPKQFFADHPDLKPKKDWRDGHAVYVPKIKPKPLCTIPDYVVDRSVRFNHDSDLITFLKTFLDPLVVEGLIEDYRIGVTRSGDTIFFQLDKLGRCRTGKIMKYDAETGHCIKDTDVPGRITWVHSLMKQSGQLPKDWELSQCLFGEHLLLEHPGMPVALVESEKTAVICSGLMHQYLWLATGGKSCINDRLLVLQGRKIIAFPDIDGFQDWTTKLAKYPQLGITVSPILNQNATAEDLEAHIDIADWLIRYRHSRPDRESPRHRIDFLKAARYISPEYHEELEALIEDFDLEFWGVERIEKTENEEAETSDA